MDFVDTLTAVPVWPPSVVLAAILLGDALLSIKPARFIRDCLEGVKLDPEWWWALIYIKVIAVIGLLLGLILPGVWLVASLGVVLYFCAAIVAHVRARYFGTAFWLNCLGMFVISLAVLVLDLMFKA